MLSMTNMVSGKKASQKDKIQEKAEEETHVLATRFLAFDEACVIVMQHLPLKPYRNYSSFKSVLGESTRPLPQIQWDS